MKPTPSDAQRQFVDLPSGRAAFIDEGRGPAIVCVHGLPGSARDFRWLAPHIAESARIIRVDLMGFGESPAVEGANLSPLGRARFVIELIQALDLKEPVILGHSMGGIVASAAVHLEPKLFKGLALISSPGVRPHAMFARTPFGRLSWLFSKRISALALRPVLRRAYVKTGFRGYSDESLVRTIHTLAKVSISEHASRIRALELPTLVAWCDDDPLIEAHLMAELAEVCPAGPRLQFETGGHNPQKHQAEKLGKALVEFGR